MDVAQKLEPGKYIKTPYTLEKIGLAIKEDLGKNGQFLASFSMLTYLLLQDFFEESEGYVWQCYMIFEDVLRGVMHESTRLEERRNMKD
ncbi:MAG: hypothetical protein ISS62_12050 [Desulfobacteraceae bacterium]|nr:hypothetical protein [Desulfobacteraceae bacterium]